MFMVLLQRALSFLGSLIADFLCVHGPFTQDFYMVHFYRAFFVFMALLQRTLCFLGSLIADFLCVHDPFLQDSMFMDILYKNFYVLMVFLATTCLSYFVSNFPHWFEIVHPHLSTVNIKLALPVKPL